MIRKIHLFITVIAVVVGSCKDVDKKVTKQEAALPIQPNGKPVDSSQIIVGSPEVQDYKDRLHYIVERMNKSFGKVPTTGNPEDDFSKLMITNQFAGIEMCELHIKTGSDTIMKALAKRKLAFLQKQEEIFHNYQFNSPAGYRPTVKKAVPRLKHLEIGDASDKDVVFAHILSEYNQNTIDLAKAYLQNGTNASMKSAAQTIIQNFGSELQQMKRYITTH